MCALEKPKEALTKHKKFLQGLNNKKLEEKKMKLQEQEQMKKRDETVPNPLNIVD